MSGVWKISRLIERLEGIRNRDGDLPVYIFDADTEWHLPIVDTPWPLERCVSVENGRVLIASSYTAADQVEE